jgi:hypothetical protein
MAQKSLDLIEAMRVITEKTQPITGRGVGYKLFTAGLIPLMARSEMQRVYRLLKEAREQGTIPWNWIVDETRELEIVSAWEDPDKYTDCVIRSCRRDYWQQQPVRVVVWSEKGTVRGIIRPVLDAFGVGFQVMHGFGSATTIHGVADDDDGRPLIAPYVGDWDPSGLCMSEHDLPNRLSKYDGEHVTLKRIALIRSDLRHLPSFPATDKKKDPRFKWFVANYGLQCWELDALDPNELRARVQKEIIKQIEPTAWNRCKTVEHAERQSLCEVLKAWKVRRP